MTVVIVAIGPRVATTGEESKVVREFESEAVILVMVRSVGVSRSLSVAMSDRFRFCPDESHAVCRCCLCCSKGDTTERWLEGRVVRRVEASAA